MADGILSHLKLSWGSCFGIEAYFIGSGTSDTSFPTVLGSDVWYGLVSGWLALSDRCLGPMVGLGLLHSTHIPSCCSHIPSPHWWLCLLTPVGPPSVLLASTGELGLGDRVLGTIANQESLTWDPQ